MGYAGYKYVDAKFDSPMDFFRRMITRRLVLGTEKINGRIINPYRAKGDDKLLVEEYMVSNIDYRLKLLGNRRFLPGGDGVNDVPKPRIHRRKRVVVSVGSSVDDKVSGVVSDNASLVDKVSVSKVLVVSNSPTMTDEIKTMPNKDNGGPGSRCSFRSISSSFDYGMSVDANRFSVYCSSLDPRLLEVIELSLDQEYTSRTVPVHRRAVYRDALRALNAECKRMSKSNGCL